MLFLNGEHTTIDNVLEIINREKGTSHTRTSLSSTFRKNPMYKINPITEMIDLGESKRRGQPVNKNVKGRDILTRFTFFSTKDGKHYEVRYTDTLPYTDQKTNRVIYKPKSIDLSGPNHTVTDADTKSLEKMTFIYMHPLHSKSPLYTPGKVFKYTHINNDELFEQKAVQNNNIVTALQHAGTLNDVDIVIFAKSLKIPVNGLTSGQARTQLQSFLLAGNKNVEQYLSHMNDQSEVFIGRIIDAIDNGQIVSQKAGNATIWSFNLADNKSPIVTVPLGSDIRDGLINHIKRNISEFAPIIHNISRENQEDFEYREYFDKMETPSTPTKVLVEDGDDILISEITKHKEAKDYYHRYFDRKTSAPPAIAGFFKAIQSGEITDENVDTEIQRFAPKS